jgi:hypothetical protein
MLHRYNSNINHQDEAPSVDMKASMEYLLMKYR